MFDLDRFIHDCRAAVRADTTHRTVHDVVARAFDDPAAITAALGEPTEAGITPLYRAADLTILNVVWRPMMTLAPHDHRTWAVLGIYGGREDNIFWRRVKGDSDGRIEAAGARALSTGDVCVLGKDIIHSVTNPIARLSGAIHVYGGDFFAIERSGWDAENLTEHPHDMATTQAAFAGS